MWHDLLIVIQALIEVGLGFGGGLWFYHKKVSPNYKERWLKAVELLKEEKASTAELTKLEKQAAGRRAQAKDEWTLASYTRQGFLFFELRRPDYMPIQIDYSEKQKGLPTGVRDFDRKRIDYQDKAALMLADLDQGDGIKIDPRHV